MGQATRFKERYSKVIRARLLAIAIAVLPANAFAALPAHIMDACAPQVSACFTVLDFDVAPGTVIPPGELYYQDIYSCLQASELDPNLFLYFPFENLVDALCNNSFPVRERAYNALLGVCSSLSACGSILWYDAIADRAQSLCPEAQRRVAQLQRECSPVQEEIQEIPLAIER